MKNEKKEQEPSNLLRRALTKKYEREKIAEEISEKRPYKYKHLIISEESTWKMIWDIFVIACVLYVAFVVPFRLGFHMKDTLALMTVSYSIDVCFLIDIILTFLTEVYDEVECLMIATHRQIAIHYLKGWFLFDLVSIFPFELLFRDDNNLTDINQGIRIARITKI